MKKIILILILFLGIYPTFHDGKLCVTATNAAIAQGQGDEGEGSADYLKDLDCWYDPPEDSYDQEHWDAVAENLENILDNLYDAIDDANSEAYNEWINDMNDWVQDQIDEMDGIWAGFYEQSGPYDPGDAADWWDYINNINNNNVNSNNPGYNPPPPDSAWFITVNGNDSIQYHRSDTIYTMQLPGKTIKLNVDRSPYGTIPNITWKRNDTLKCSSVAYCNFDVSNLGSYRVKVDSAGTKNLINVVVKVYPMPTFYFKRGANYNSSYGFDDSTHKYLKDSARYAAGYEVKHIGKDTAYYVPWMSLLDSQTVNIKDTLINLSADAKKDRNGKLILVPSNNKITINGLPSVAISYNQLSVAHTLPIKAVQLDARNDDSLKTIGCIYALTTFGDTIGKLNLSCAKPVKKKVFIVYVNTGTGFKNYSKDGIIDSLNHYSHNQIFRKWVLDTITSVPGFDSATVAGMDTLNVSNEFGTQHAKFMDDSILIKYIDTLYQNHKHGMSMAFDVNTISQSALFTNDSAKIHFVFIFNYSLPTTTVGSTQGRGYISMLFAPAYWQTNAHELGHILGIQHPFSEPSKINPAIMIPRYNIPKYSTRNFMDDVMGTDLTNMFYYAQWLFTY